MTKESRRELLIGLALAAFTTFLTLTGSIWLQSRQLSKEQDYWLQRSKKEKLSQFADKQMSLLEEINGDLLTSELLMKELKLNAALINANTAFNTGRQEALVNDLSNKVMDYQKHLHIVANKLQSAVFFFGPKVDSTINSLQSSLAKNYDNNMLLNRMPNALTPEDYFRYDFDTISELTRDREKLLRFMQEEISENLKDLYNDE